MEIKLNRTKSVVLINKCKCKFKINRLPVVYYLCSFALLICFCSFCVHNMGAFDQKSSSIYSDVPLMYAT